GRVKNAFALVRPPGHHANPLRSSGFCIFNNIAILAEYLIKKKDIKRVAIFDIDLHHGNGTSEIFYSRNDVLFFSSHQDGRTQYPGSGFIHEIGEGEGKGYNINVPLSPGAGDDVAYSLIDHVVRPVFEHYKPDIILGSIGADAHYSDPLSGLEFTVQGYAKIVKLFKDVAETSGNGRMILTLEGGYKVKVLAQVVVNILRTLADEDITFKDSHPSSNDKITGYHRELEKHLKETLGKYWKL
nr:histone deacetylase [Candidatus Sigynarchaeota archaeon]